MLNTIAIATENAETNSNLIWDDLEQIDRKIIIAVLYEDGPEEARKALKLTHSTFYRHWDKVKKYYNDLIKEFPKRAGEILISQSMKAAQELGNELDSENEKTRHTAAIEILDRTLSKEPAEVGLKRKITLEEFIGPSTFFAQTDS